MKLQTRTLPALGLALAVVTTVGAALAQEDTREVLLPHTFESGDVISADQMNSNFAEIVDAINTTNVNLKDKEDIIQPAGAFAGSISTVTTGANFSLLPGTDGAVGLAAAHAACEAEYPGAHAELDQARLWKSAIDGDLAHDYYWAATDIVTPRSGTFFHVPDCDGWTSNSDELAGSTINVQAGVNMEFFASEATSTNAVAVNLDHYQSCKQTAVILPGENEYLPEGYDGNPKIACFLD